MTSQKTKSKENGATVEILYCISGGEWYEDYSEEGSKQSQRTGGQVEPSVGGGRAIQDTAAEGQDRVKGSVRDKGDVASFPGLPRFLLVFSI